MKGKRVLIFSLTYFPFVGGAEIAVKEITDRIASDDIAFDMVTLRADTNLPSVEKIGSVTVHRIGPGKRGITPENLFRFPWYLIKVLFVPLAMFKARELARAKPYDAYWAIMTNMGFPIMLLRMLFRDTTPYILTLQDGDTKEHITSRRRIKIFSGLLARIFKEAVVVQAISRFLARFARDMGYPRDAVVVPNGVSYAYFSDPKWRKGGHKLVYRFDKKPNEIYLMTTSRLVEKNGIADVIKAVHKLPERFKFLVIGEGVLGESLWQLATSLGIDKRVRFLGSVPHLEIPAYLSLADVFVRPSLSEGMGNSFIEAMAASVPVIGTQVGGITDFLVDPESPMGKVAPTGLFCRPHDPESIVHAVIRLTENEDLRKRIVVSAREMVKHTYDWGKITKEMKAQVFEPVFLAAK